MLACGKQTMDRVFINGISVYGKHGVHESERQNEQEFIVDIAAQFDTRKAAASDDLNDTVDYMPFAQMITQVVQQHSFYLIERLAERIAERVLEDTRIQEVNVTVKKPAALTNGLPGVTIVRTRS